jgi:hypothetical protein
MGPGGFTDARLAPVKPSCKSPRCILIVTLLPRSQRDGQAVAILAPIETAATKGGSAAMDMNPMGEAGEMMIDAGDQRTAALRRMTAEQLLQLGTRQVVYLKAGMRNGELAFVLYGADGKPLVMVDTVETALEMAAENGLGFVAIH